MVLKARPFVSFVRNAVVVFLAVAVFSWGLQAKLELYKPPAVQKPLIAKLLTERHSATILKILKRRDAPRPNSPVPALASVSRLLLSVPVLQSVTQEAAIGLSHPGKPYLHGVYSLNLPPPLRS